MLGMPAAGRSRRPGRVDETAGRVSRALPLPGLRAVVLLQEGESDVSLPFDFVRCHSFIHSYKGTDLTNQSEYGTRSLPFISVYYRIITEERKRRRYNG